MKIHEAVFFTDNTTVRLESDEGPFYLTDEKKVYDMHPINVMAKEIKGAKLKEVKAAAKKDKYKDDVNVRKWL
jgi:hypothetical protein